MRHRVAITGIGIISSLGDSPALLHWGLCHGHNGLQVIEDSSFEYPIDRQVAHIPSFRAECYLPGKNLRPLDRTGQLVAAAAKLALRNSNWSPEMLADKDVGLALGTMFGSAHTISKFDRQALMQGPAYASPMDFANTVINAAAGQTAIWHNLRGINSTIACGYTSGLMALAYATDLIRYGQQTAILAGGADEFCFESFSGFKQAGLLYQIIDGTGCSVPFAARRTGLALGEGVALLMLEAWDSAMVRGVPILGEIIGYGSTYQYRPNGRDGSDAILRAIEAACEDAGIALEDIDCISAAANGSIMTDRDEAVAIKALWKNFISLVPVTAIKSMLGETLGASGALQTVALIETIKTGVLPGVLDLDEIEPGFPCLNISQRPRAVRVRCGLVNSIGLDGHACALLISQPSTTD